jgi:hypothetical protein
LLYPAGVPGSPVKKQILKKTVAERKDPVGRIPLSKAVAQALSVLFQNVKHDDFLWYHELMT